MFNHQVLPIFNLIILEKGATVDQEGLIEGFERILHEICTFDKVVSSLFI